MSTKYRVALSLVLIFATLMFLVGCGGGCPTQTGGGTGTGGGTPSGVTNTACSTGGTPPPPPPSGNNSYVYFANASSILAAKFNTSGTFSALNPFTPITLPSSLLNGMAVVSSKFLYIPLNGFSNVQAFTINQSSGALTAISGSPFLAQAGADSVTSDPSGRFLFVGGRNAALIAVYRIDATTGVLTAVPGSPFQSFNVVFSNSLAVDGSGKFLYVGQTFSTNPVAVFSINQTTGALTETPNSPFALGVSVLNATPNGKFLLGVPDDTALTTDNHVRVFSINSTTGDLTPVTGSPFATVNIPFGLSVHPNGNLVYASTADASRMVQSIEGFQLDANGKLTALAGSPFTSIPVVADCQFVQSGADAICMNATGFSVLGVNTTTGALSHTVPDLVTAGNFPFAATN